MKELTVTFDILVVSCMLKIKPYQQAKVIMFG